MTSSESFTIQPSFIQHHFDLQYHDDMNLDTDLFSFISSSLIDGLTERESDELLQENLVHDVFLSPAIIHTEQAILSASSSQTGDDNYSFMSSSSDAASSPVYQYEDNMDNLIFSDTKTTANDQQYSFLGFDLHHSLPEETDIIHVIKKNCAITKKQPHVYKKRLLDKAFKQKEHKKLDSPTFHKEITSHSIYQLLTKESIDWCRYCGTTEGVNWRPGPWGKRTLCNKHGCDYKGYGFACKLPRLDLTAFQHETMDERHCPVLQLFCSHCHQQEDLIYCHGCPKSYHQHCNADITDHVIGSKEPWYCSEECKENIKDKRVIVELPRKKLPLMRTPKDALVS